MEWNYFSNPFIKDLYKMVTNLYYFIIYNADYYTCKIMIHVFIYIVKISIQFNSIQII